MLISYYVPELTVHVDERKELREQYARHFNKAAFSNSGSSEDHLAVVEQINGDIEEEIDALLRAVSEKAANMFNAH